MDTYHKYQTLQSVKEAGNFICNISHLNTLCRKIKEQPRNVYDLIEQYGGEADTVTREAIFSYIANKYYDGDYDRIYKRWQLALIRNYGA